DLFSAWRLFFERLADKAPTVLVFEDLQWADAALLDFIQYLLEWSRTHPLFVITLARPELVDSPANWAAGKRDFTSLCLQPLPPLIAARLDGLTPPERRVLEDASVLGKTFTKQGLSALSGTAGDELEPLLASLVRKEILTLQKDVRSPERGQYGFLQALVQK